MLFVGIDNANDGAATIFDLNKNCLGTISWKVVTRKKKKKFNVGFYHSLFKVEKAYICDKDFVQLSCIIARILSMYNCENIQIAIEDVYVRNNIKTCIILAKNAATVAAILQHKLDTNVEWVLPRVWRSNLDMKKQKRNKAKEDSLYYIPMIAKGLDESLEALGKLDHITDSAGIALYLIDKHRRDRSVKR